MAYGCIRSFNKYTTKVLERRRGMKEYNRGRLLALQGVSREAKGDGPVRYAMCEITITPNALPSTQLGFRAPIYIRMK